MEIDKLPTYKDISEYLESKNRQKHLLLGNGFSMAYDPKIFSYNALSTFIEKTENELLKKLFNLINSKNFELIMQQLDNFLEIAINFSKDNDFIERIRIANSTLKVNLIQAVESLHPEHVFKITEEQSKLCYSFIEDFTKRNGYVFSTNYDLLLYWVLMRNTRENVGDGFGRDRENPDEKDEDPVFSELRWGKYKDDQTIHYLHGALHIFDDGIDIIKEEYDSEHFLLKNIKKRMDDKQYPVFVTAGSGTEKLMHIMHNKYLSYCYDKFCNIEGSLISFGFSFSEYDDHIIKAINKASKGKSPGEKLFSIYIGVYSDDGYKRIKEIENKFKCKVNIFNAKTINLWQ